MERTKYLKHFDKQIFRMANLIKCSIDKNNNNNNNVKVMKLRNKVFFLNNFMSQTKHKFVCRNNKDNTINCYGVRN